MNIIDFHSHILPYADHGCSSPEVSAIQLKYAKRNNISTIVSTSHFYPDRHTVDQFVERQRVGFSYVTPVAESLGINLISGAETHWCKNIERMDGIDHLFIKNKCLLLELPFNDFNVDDVKNTTEALHSQGIDTVLAHVERYPTDKILQFDEKYVHYQINAYSFFNFRCKRIIRTFLSTGKVMALGSDIHGSTDTYKYFSRFSSRYPQLFSNVMTNSMTLLYE